MEFYEKETILTTITQKQLVEMSRMLKFLVDKGKITKQCGQITLNRIAKNNELEPIYIW